MSNIAECFLSQKREDLVEPTLRLSLRPHLKILIEESNIMEDSFQCLSIKVRWKYLLKELPNVSEDDVKARLKGVVSRRSRDTPMGYSLLLP